MPKHPTHLKIQRAKPSLTMLAARFSLSARRVVNIGTSWKVERSAMNAEHVRSVNANNALAVAGKVRINTQEVAKLLGIDPAYLRLLMRKGKIKAPPILFDPKTNSTVRMWSEDDIEQARKVWKDLRVE